MGKRFTAVPSLAIGAEKGDVLQDGKIGKFARGQVIPQNTCQHFWRDSLCWGNGGEVMEMDVREGLFNTAKAMGVSEMEVQSLFDCGCSCCEIEALLNTYS